MKHLSATTTTRKVEGDPQKKAHSNTEAMGQGWYDAISLGFREYLHAIFSR